MIHPRKVGHVALGRLEEGIAAAEHGVAVSHRGADFLGLLGWALATATTPRSLQRPASGRLIDCHLIARDRDK